MTLDPTSERKFTTLKRRLETLNYHQPLGIESAPLVEGLLTDLVKTTESFRRLTNEHKKLYGEWQLLSAQVDPIKRENTRIIRENNRLHSELIQLKESEDAKERTRKTVIKKAETDLQHLKLVYQQQQTKLRATERELEKARRRTDDLLNRQTPIAVVGPDGDVHELHGRNAQKIEIDGGFLEEGEARKPSRGVDPYVCDLVQMADKRIENLERELNSAVAEARKKAEDASVLGDKVEEREREIERLAQIVESERNFDKAAMDDLNKANQSVIEQLNSQVDYLNEELNKAEEEASKRAESAAELQKVLDENHRLTERVKELVVEKKSRSVHKDTLNTSLGDEDDEVVMDDGVDDNALAQARAAQEKLSSQQQYLVELAAENKKLKTQVSALMDEQSHVKSLLKTYSKDKEELSILLEKNEEDMKVIRERCNGTGDRLQQLTSELSREKDAHVSTRASLATVESELEVSKSAVSKLERDVDRERARSDALQDSLRSAEQTIEGQSADTSTLRQEWSRLTEENSKMQENVTRLRKELDNTRREHSDLLRNRSQGERDLDHVLGERNRLREEVEALRTEIESTLKTDVAVKDDNARLEDELKAAQHTAEVFQEQHRKLSEQLNIRTRELDERTREVESLRRTGAQLEGAVGARDKILTELDSFRSKCDTLLFENASLLNAEKEHKATVGRMKEAIKAAESESATLREQVDESLTEMNALRREVADKNSVIGTLTAERDSNRDLYAQTAAELKSYLENSSRSKVEGERASMEVRRLQQELAACQHSVETVTREKDGLVTQLAQVQKECDGWRTMAGVASDEASEQKESMSTVKAAMDSAVEEARRAYKTSESLQTQLNEAVARARTLEQEVQDKDFELTQMKSLVSRVDHNRGDLTQQLTDASSRISSLSAEVQRLKEELTSSATTVADKEGEISQLRRVVSQMDGDRDSLQLDLDAKMEGIHKLKQEIGAITEEKSAAEKAAVANQKQAESFLQQLNAKDKEVTSLRTQLDKVSRAGNDTQSTLVAKQEEIRTLTEDLARMTRENQLVNQELVSAVGERDAIQGELQEATARVLYLEELVKVKDSEAVDLLTNYRSLNADKERVSTINMKLESELRDAENNLAHCQEEHARAEQALQHEKQEVHRLNVDMHAYELQVDQLSRMLGKLQGDQQHSTAEKGELAGEVMATKNLVSSLENVRENLEKKLAMVQQDNVIMARRLQQAEEEVEATNAQVGEARSRSKELESVIVTLRSQKAFSEMSDSDRVRENNSLREQLRNVQDQMEATRRDLHAQITTNNTLRLDMDATKREMSHLRTLSGGSPVPAPSTSQSQGRGGSPDKEQLMGVLRNYESELKANTNKISDLEHALEMSTERETSLQLQVKKKEADAQQLEILLQDKYDKLSEAESEIGRLSAIVKGE